jgi:protein-tyrosine phosphatase
MCSALRLATVCTGNICRSPMAAVVFAQALAAAGIEAQVTSVGISDEERGNPIDPRARRVLQARGFGVPNHRARRVTQADLAASDLLLPMTYQHFRALRRLAQAAGLDPEIRMVREFAPQFKGREAASALDIDDPWYGGPADFEAALDQIEEAAPGIVAWAEAAGADRA